MSVNGGDVGGWSRIYLLMGGALRRMAADHPFHGVWCAGRITLFMGGPMLGGLPFNDVAGKSSTELMWICLVLSKSSPPFLKCPILLVPVLLKCALFLVPVFLKSGPPCFGFSPFFCNVVPRVFGPHRFFENPPRDTGSGIRDQGSGIRDSAPRHGFVRLGTRERFHFSRIFFCANACFLSN